MDLNLPIDVPWLKEFSFSYSHLWVVFVICFSTWFFMQFIKGRNAMRSNLKNTQIMLDRIQKEMERNAVHDPEAKKCLEQIKELNDKIDNENGPDKEEKISENSSK